MRYDDTLETVLTADLSTPFGRQSVWRQLVDLIGRRRVPVDSRAIETLNSIRKDIPPPVRKASARMLEFADPPAALVRLFAVDEIAIALPVLKTARLSSQDWIDLLPKMAPASRTVLRNRRDLGPKVFRALEAYGPTDLVLGDGRAPEPVAALADSESTPADVVVAASDSFSDPTDQQRPEMVPQFVDGADTDSVDKGSVVSMNPMDHLDADPAEDRGDRPDSDHAAGPIRTGAPRFVQVGAIALGLPVVAEAVRSADPSGPDAVSDDMQTDAVPASADAAPGDHGMDQSSSLRLAESLPSEPVAVHDDGSTPAMVASPVEPADTDSVAAPGHAWLHRKVSAPIEPMVAGAVVDDSLSDAEATAQPMETVTDRDVSVAPTMASSVSQAVPAEAGKTIRGVIASGPVDWWHDDEDAKPVVAAVDGDVEGKVSGDDKADKPVEPGLIATAFAAFQATATTTDAPVEADGASVASTAMDGATAADADKPMADAERLSWLHLPDRSDTGTDTIEPPVEHLSDAATLSDDAEVSQVDMADTAGVAVSSGDDLPVEPPVDALIDGPVEAVVATATADDDGDVADAATAVDAHVDASGDADVAADVTPVKASDPVESQSDSDTTAGPQADVATDKADASSGDPDLLKTPMGAAAVSGVAIMVAATAWAKKIGAGAPSQALPAETADTDDGSDKTAPAANIMSDVAPTEVDSSDAPPAAAPTESDHASPALDAIDTDAGHQTDDILSDDVAIAPVGDATDHDAGSVVADADGLSSAVTPVALAGLGLSASAALGASGEHEDGPVTTSVDQPKPDASDAEAKVTADHDDAPVAQPIAALPTATNDTEPATAGSDHDVPSDAKVDDGDKAIDSAAADGGDRDGPFRIADVVARIDAYQRRQPDFIAHTASSDAVEAEGFRFEADASGVIRWVEGVTRGPLIGLALDQVAPDGGYGFDASVAGAFRHRASFNNARLCLAGRGEAAGDWLVSAVPVFDSKTGRFTGYRGAARRPRLDDRAEPRAASRAGQIDSLRELIHELRTPAGAITGFAELIEAQMLGPVPTAYRDQAMSIRTEARELLAIIDDLDFASRIEARALTLRPGAIALKPLIKSISEQLEPLAKERGTWCDLPAADLSVRGDERAVDRLLARLLATVVGSAGQGERIAISYRRDAGNMINVEISRPVGLDVDASAEPGEDDDTLLGTAFSLRLAKNLAQELGGALVFEADRLTLRLPAADDPDMEQAVQN